MRTFWRIIKLLGDYKWLTIVGFALAFIQMGLGLLVPRITQLTINNALIGGQTGKLVVYGLALLGIAIVRFVVAVGPTARPPARRASASSTTCATACGRGSCASPRATSIAGPPGSS